MVKDREAGHAGLHGVTKSRMQLNNKQQEEETEFIHQWKCNKFVE